MISGVRARRSNDARQRTPEIRLNYNEMIPKLTTTATLNVPLAPDRGCSPRRCLKDVTAAVTFAALTSALYKPHKILQLGNERTTSGGSLHQTTDPYGPLGPL